MNEWLNSYIWPYGVWSEAPANFYSGAFWASGENDYEDFLSQNTEIVCT